MAHEKGYPRVTIHWDDAWSRTTTWTEAKSFAKELLQSAPMYSTGWLIAQDDERIALAYELDEQGDSRRTQTIHRKMITSIEYLEPVEKPTKAKGKRK